MKLKLIRNALVDQMTQNQESDQRRHHELESGYGSWYCKAVCGLCSGAVLYGHKAVPCDKCEMWIHNECSLITEFEFDSVENTNCTWICPKCDF